MSEVVFRTLPFAQCADVVAAFRNSQREAQRDAGYFDWRYSRRPSGLPAYVTLGFDAGGTAVAAASLIPHDFLVAEVPVKAGMIGDVSVSASMRGKGLAARLLAQLRDDAFARGLDACFVLPNAELTGALTRTGFEHVGAIRRAIRVLGLRGRLTQKLGPVGGLAGALIDGLWRTAGHLADGQLPDRFGTAEPTAFDARYDALWARLPKADTALAVRDSTWLGWRFAAKPGGRYRLFELTRGAELAGYVVHHAEPGLVYVDDFLAADLEAAQLLGRAFASAARAGRWADSIQIRYVEQAGDPAAGHSTLAVPFSGGGYHWRADSQAVMWTATDRVPQPRHWYVTPADKDV
ncbi:MAG TPA: GNAT family N-acetyltransferase [Steroidobacteraceae bacterium]|nr:GNAT family N-acetyltransferase [Steroidobacteraceae bacterium]